MIMPAPAPSPRPPSWWRIFGLFLAVAVVGVAIDVIFDAHLAAWLVGLAVVCFVVWRRRRG